jgi:hypothetical protein
MSGITQEQLLWRIIDKLNEAIHSQHETIEFLMNKRLKQPEWVGLTEEEVKDFQVNKFVGPNLIRAIERRLKEKNA